MQKSIDITKSIIKRSEYRIRAGGELFRIESFFTFEKEHLTFFVLGKMSTYVNWQAS